MEQMNKERNFSQRPAAPVSAPPAPAEEQQSRNKGTKRIPVRWIVLGAAALCAVALAVGLIAGLTGEPRVKCAEDAIDVLADRAGDLGYANALSELTELHSATVGGNSYYRLQQNYHGIPVYGRSVVYAADRSGSCLSVTQNIQDIPEGLNLTPSITRIQATDSIRTYLTEAYPEQDWSGLPILSLDEDALCIYDLDGTAHLAYEAYWNTVAFILDAHSAEVLSCCDTIRTARATFAGNGEMLDVLRFEDGTYVLKDENTGTYVFSAQGQSYYDPSRFDKLDSSVLQLITSPDNIFGDGNDSISDPDSIAKAVNLLNTTNDIRAFYESNVGKLPIDNLILVYDDHINNTLNGTICGGGWTTVSNVLGFGKDLSDIDPDNHAKNTGMISVGTSYSYSAIIPENIRVDVIAHEYTHVVTGCIVDWTQGNDENESLDEAYSDIFGELFQGYTSGSYNWINSGRNIANPTLTNNASVAGENGLSGPFPSANGTDNFRYHYSTVISHAAYKMWAGFDSIPASAISTDDLARLWYTSMLMLPSDAEFSDCRAAVTLAAEHMGLTDAQQQGIARAFDEAGIYDDRFSGEVCYLVDENFTLTVYGDDNEPYGNYRIEIEEQCSAIEILPWKNYHSVSDEPGEHCIMKLEKDVYSVTLTNLANQAQTISFYLKVEDGGSDQLNLYTNFAKPGENDPSVPSSGEQPTDASAEPSETTPSDSPAVDTSGEVPYRIVLWDRSYRTENDESGMDYTFGYVVLEGDSAVCQKINDYLYADAERFMTLYSADSVITDGFGYPIIGQCHAQSYVIYNQNGLLCVKVVTDEYMGGNTNHVDSYSMFFSLNTGEIATLVELTGIDAETLLPMLRDIAITKLREHYGSMLLDSAERTVSNMSLDDFDYYVLEGEIWLNFDKYSVTPGVCGAANIPTGLYVGGSPD